MVLRREPLDLTLRGKADEEEGVGSAGGEGPGSEVLLAVLDGWQEDVGAEADEELVDGAGMETVTVLGCWRPRGIQMPRPRDDGGNEGSEAVRGGRAAARRRAASLSLLSHSLCGLSRAANRPAPGGVSSLRMVSRTRSRMVRGGGSTCSAGDRWGHAGRSSCQG